MFRSTPSQYVKSVLVQCIGGQPWTILHWRPVESLVCEALRQLTAQHWPGVKMANQWLEMKKQCGERGRVRGLTLYPANKRGASASTILTVEETRRSRTDRVRHVVSCIAKHPTPPPFPTSCQLHKKMFCQGEKRPDSHHCKSDNPPPPPQNTTPTAATL